MLKHLHSRKCNPVLYPGIGIHDDVVHFPMYDFSFKRTGYCAYRPDGAKKNNNDEKYGKYYTYITKGEVGVFGLESFDFSNIIFLVGGVFKATALHNLGYTALHISNIKPSILRQQLTLYNRPFVGIGDNDAEGNQFARRWDGVVSPKDVDELDDEYIIRMVNDLIERANG